MSKRPSLMDLPCWLRCRQEQTCWIRIDVPSGFKLDLPWKGLTHPGKQLGVDKRVP